jgi:GNAT superfamily N-acetyltransferase
VLAEHELTLHTCRWPGQYFFSFSTWTSKPSLYLEDLYVIPTLRNKGVGKLLFKALGQVAQQRDCARLDWSVLTWNA